MLYILVRSTDSKIIGHAVPQVMDDGLLAAKIKGLFFIPFQQGMNMKETDLYDLARALEGTI